MLNVSGSSWHAKIYKWWRYKVKYKPHTNQVNLCPYMRAVLLWAPIRFLFAFEYILFEIKEFEIYPRYLTYPVLLYTVPKLAGYLSYELKYGIYFFESICAAIVIIITGIIITAYISDRISMKEKFSKLIDATANSGFCKLIVTVLMSIHQGVCPSLVIDDPEEEEEDPNQE